MCSRLNCRFVHLTEDHKVEVCDQRVAVCRDYANGQCRRKLCKYYHIPVALPPANIMATIFNQQPSQQPQQHHQQLATTSTITSIEQQQQEQLQQRQQLPITINTTRATSATYTSLSNHNNNNNLVNSFNNNILYDNNIESNNNTLKSQQQCIISPPLPSSYSPSTTQITSPATKLINASVTSNLTALTTSTTTIPTPAATAATNLSAVAIAAAAYTPTFPQLLNVQPLLASNLAYYDLASDFSTNCIPLLSANQTYAAAPIIYPSAAAHQPQHHRQQNPQLTESGLGIIKNIQLGTAIGQQVAPNVANLSAIATTST